MPRRKGKHGFAIIKIIIGVIGTLGLSVISFDIPQSQGEFSVIGYDITPWVYALITVLVGIGFGYLANQGLRELNE